MKNKLLLSIFYFICCFAVYTQSLPVNDAVAEQMKNILLESYDNYEGLNFKERLVLSFGKRTFVDCVLLWRANYADIEKITVRLHPQLFRLAEKVSNLESSEKSARFEAALKELTFLGFCNLDLYYKALMKVQDLPEMFTTADIDDALAKPEFFLLKKQLYENEDLLKQEIRSHLASKECKSKLGLYLFFFDFVNKIRKDIIRKDIEKSYQVILKKQKSFSPQQMN